MEKTLRKFGAYSILGTMLSGLVFAGVEWDKIKTTVERHEKEVSKIDRLFKLNCELAIQVVKSREIVSKICVGQLEGQR
jgi:carbonic anhydrase